MKPVHVPYPGTFHRYWILEWIPAGLVCGRLSGKIRTWCRLWAPKWYTVIRARKDLTSTVSMAGIGMEEGMVSKALDAVKKRLDCEHGIVLNNPPYTRYYIEYGEISSYPAGYKENAGIFCHNNPWIIIGETMQGRGDRAWEYFRKICPSYTEAHSDLHKVEPYVYAQMIAGKDAFRPGEAKNSWLTGTAAWNYYAISQYILGIKPDYESLEVNPCIPPDWKGYTVTRKFRGATYHIRVNNPDGRMKGLRSLTVDGEPVQGNRIPLKPAGSVCHVVAEL